MIFASIFDERLFHEGPPAIFTLDPKGKLRVDPERSREIYLELDPGAREAGHYVLTDTVTGLRMYLLVTHPLMAEKQPRGTVERFDDYAPAVEAAGKQWAPEAEELG